MRRFLYLGILLLTSLMFSCSDDDQPGQQPTIDQQVEQQLSSLTLKQKICQMFFVRPEAMYLGVEEVDRGKMTETKLSSLDNESVRRILTMKSSR